MTQAIPDGATADRNEPDIEQSHRQGLRVYRDLLDARQDPRGRPYYWIGGEAPTGVPEDGTDFGALAEGYVSITPLHLDLTAHQSMETLRGWSWE